MHALVVVLLLGTSPPTPFAAEGAPPPHEAEGAPPPHEKDAKDEGAAKPSLSPPLDFDLLPPEPDAAAAALDPRFDAKVRRRRKMLRVHQGLGIATWSALAATVVVGQLDFNDRFRGGGDTGRYHGAHKLLAYGTSTLFLGTGLLGLLAPEPYEKKLRLDTATLHKTSMGLAAAGMATQIALGLLARGSAGELRERDLARAHQVTGYATLGAMTVGALVLFF